MKDFIKNIFSNRDSKPSKNDWVIEKDSKVIDRKVKEGVDFAIKNYSDTFKLLENYDKL